MGDHYWGWLVAIYLFLGGVGAGSFLIAAAAELSGYRYRQKFCVISLVGAGVSGPVIALGTVILILDLGAGRLEPWRILYMFTHLTSVMTWGIWVLTLFVPVCFLYGLIELMHIYPSILTWLRKRLRFLPETLPYQRIKRYVCIGGGVLAVATATYTAVLLSVVRAIPFWHSWVLIPLFLVSALSVGMGLTVDLSGTIAVGPMERRLKNLPLYHLVLIVAEAVLIAVLMALALMRGGMAAESARMILLGRYSLLFWVVVVIFGLVYPVSVHAFAFGAHEHGRVSGILSGAGIVIAGLYLRYLIVAGGLPALP